MVSDLLSRLDRSGGFGNATSLRRSLTGGGL